AAQTRGSYFDTLPAAELAAIKAAPAGSFGAGLWTGVTHLPGHDHVGAALSEGLFAVNASRLGLGAGVIVYNLLTSTTLDLPYLPGAGSPRKTKAIPGGGAPPGGGGCACGERGSGGGPTAPLKGNTPPPPAADPRPRRQGTSSRSTAASQLRRRRAP